jgi:anti-sigma B factor antagonist
VSDDGTGLRPDLQSKGFGLGLPLIARVSDDYRIEDRATGGAMVTMRFGIERGGEPHHGEFSLKADTAAEGTVAVIEVVGEVDLRVAHQLDAALEPSPAGPKAILVDMTGVGFLDSSGMRALLLAGERFRVDGTRWALVLAEGSAVRNGLALAGVHERLPLQGSRDEALSFVSEDSG